MTDKYNQFSISEKNLNLILDVLRSYPQISKAAIFGSRAMGNFKPGSDIDIALYSKSKINLSLLAQIKSALEDEIPTPYLFDVILYEDIDNPQFKLHIDTYGKILAL